MSFEKHLDTLLWNYGVPPQLSGKCYLIHILKKIRDGSEISPRLLAETAQELGKSRTAIYSALSIVRNKIIDHCRETGEPHPRSRKHSLYEFLYWFYQKASEN